MVWVSAGNIELSSSFFERSRFDLSTCFGAQSGLEFCFAIEPPPFYPVEGPPFFSPPPFVKPSH